MLRIRRLYTDPELIENVEFFDGVNFIMGEKDTTSDKNNGVGKSLCIEFINFALLKKRSSSRVSKIPAEKFSHDAYICLDFVINKIPCTIKRSISASDKPVIIYDGDKIDFTKIEDARDFLAEKLFVGFDINHPFFRSMLAPLMRDERSEFKSLLGCYDTKEKVPDDYAPHLFLFGIDVQVYEKIKETIRKIDEYASELRARFKRS